eukprot:XP_001707948.1 Hypothetical protein GL50803_35685 [Giardia lamblia ATCC 50803]
MIVCMCSLLTSACMHCRPLRTLSKRHSDLSHRSG